MDNNILHKAGNSINSANHILHVAYNRFRNSFSIHIDKKIKMAELKVAWVLFYMLAPPMYIYAVVNNFDTWKAIFLFVLASCVGLISLARLALKFFRELLDVIMAYNEKRVSIEGAKQLYIIIALLIIIILLIAVLLFVIFK